MRTLFFGTEEKKVQDLAEAAGFFSLPKNFPSRRKVRIIIPIP
jgi:hypothetical protein